MSSPVAEYQCIAYDSPLYHEALALRYAVLRAPLGLVYTQEELAPEKDDAHIAALVESKVVAYLFLRPQDEHTMKFRQVVVADGMQGKGIGSGLIRFAENIARQQGYRTACLHARETALAFYEKLGYRKDGDAVTLVTLPHWYMWKTL